MAQSSKIKVMISSRCDDSFPLRGKNRVPLKRIREEMRREIEAAGILGRSVYEVWIHETGSSSAERDSWEECLRQAKDCDIFISLFNGNAGWLGNGDFASVGICDAELQAAYDTAAAKVSVIDIFEPESPVRPVRSQDVRFQEGIKSGQLISARAADLTQLKEALREAVAKRTIELTQGGVRAVRKGRGYLGPALDWRRLGYSERRDKMIASVVDALGGSPGDGQLYAIEFDERKILCVPAAVPDALSVAAARELVGQPHLRDHLHKRQLQKLHGGPVHIVACQGGVTPVQAQKMLGFPNATVVPAPFGVYVVDPVQAIQIVLIANCSDDHTTRLGVQNFLSWLPRSQQMPIFVETAKKRRDVVQVLAS